MGRKKPEQKVEEPQAAAKAEVPEEASTATPETKTEEGPEDPPIVKELKEIDDKYLELEREFEKARWELERKYTGLQQPYLDQRREILLKSSEEKTQSGTPALTRFWLTALKNHPAFEDTIEEWDEPVLEYVTDITKEFTDPVDNDAGFKLIFHFAENPYFTNTSLEKEYRTKVPNPWNQDIDIEEIKSTKIDWKSGKDVTVEKVQKKVKGGGAKKAKQKAKEKEEPRDSVFRSFFRSLKKGDPLPDDIHPEELEEMEDEDDEGMIELLMENDHEIGCATRDQIIPFAVRWYTGEAAPEEDDDDDEDEEEEDDDEDDEDDDDDDDEDEDDEPVPKRKGKPMAKRGGKHSPEIKPSEQPKNEECKQQ